MRFFSGINNIKDAFELFAYIATIITLSGFFVSYILSKKQIHFSTIEKCINDYRKLYHKYENKYEDPAFLGQYLDLVNEELFYIENSYLPKEVTIEWIDGMIDYLPFIHRGLIVESRKFIYLETLDRIEEKLFSYPRILKFITINNEIDFEKVFLPLIHMQNVKMRRIERNKLIYQMIKNLKINRYELFLYNLKIHN